MNLPPRQEKPDRKCETCEFFVHAGPGSDVGECRRRAPMPAVDCRTGGGSMATYWPEVDIAEFCGEWSQK